MSASLRFNIECSALQVRKTGQGCACLGIAGLCGDDYEMPSNTFNPSVTLSIDEKRQVMSNVTSSPSCYQRLSEQDRKVS